jgi:hypothetical protein
VAVLLTAVMRSYGGADGGTQRSPWKISIPGRRWAARLCRIDPDRSKIKQQKAGEGEDGEDRQA